MRRAIIGALLLIGLGVLLGGTVVRDQVASARSLAQSVVVSNTPAQAVPVREQGTLAMTPAAKFHAGGFSLAENTSATITFAQGRILASLVEVASAEDNVFLTFKDGTQNVLALGGSGHPRGGSATHDLALTQPIPMDRVDITCGSNGGNSCVVELNIVGS